MSRLDVKAERRERFCKLNVVASLRKEKEKKNKNVLMRGRMDRDTDEETWPKNAIKKK